MNGIIAVNKSAGPSSHDICFKLRKMLGEKKIGHAGTLDPLAEGVLVVLVGYAARLNEYIVSDSKEYVAKFDFGFSSDTLDITGKLIKSDFEPDFTFEELNAAAIKQTGTIMQVPPMYSAIKLDGRHLYDYARKDIVLDIPSREVTIYGIELIEADIPHTATFKIKCSSGTYIRSICRDIGDDLGCGAVMSALTRTRSGNFDISEAFSLKDIEEMILKGDTGFLLSPDCAITEIPAVYAFENARSLVQNGNTVGFSLLSLPDNGVSEGQTVRLYVGNEFKAIGKINSEGAKPVKVFN